MKRLKYIRDRRSSSNTESKNSLPTFLEKLEPRILLSGDGLLSSAAHDPLIDMRSPVVLHAESLATSEPTERQPLIDQDADPSDRVETDLLEPVLTLSFEENQETGDVEPEDEVALSIEGPIERADDPVFDEMVLAPASIDTETTGTEVIHIAVEEPTMTDPVVLIEDGSQPTDLNETNPDSEYASSIEIRGPPTLTEATSGNQIVFVDSTLTGYFQLENAENPGVVVEVLHAGSDGIQQITDILSNYQDVSAIHILSHGSPGRVQIGSVELNATSLDFYAEQIQTWGDALSSDGDIHFYGCNVSAGSTGQDLLHKIADLTGADVATSDDPTGAAPLGGDWVLERTLGCVETKLPFGPEVWATLPGLLDQTDTRNIAITYEMMSTDELRIDSQFDLENLSQTKVGDYTEVSLDGCILPEDQPGTPWLPAKYINVAIPSGTEVISMDVDADEILASSDLNVYPVQPPTPSSQTDREFTPPSPEAYAIDTKIPHELAEVTGHHTLRGYTYVSVRLNPVRYIPALKELYVATYISLTLHFSDSRPTISSPESDNSVFSELVQTLVINDDMINSYTGYAPSVIIQPEELADPAEYLIITSESLQDSFQILADHRSGFNDMTTNVVTVESIYQNPDYEGLDEQEEIRNCIVDYVQTSGTVYVVLGGDNTIVPDRDCYVTVMSSTGLEIEEHMPTDLYYAGLDSSWDEDGDGIYGEANYTPEGDDEGDLAPDVLIGRIPVRTASQASAYINKLIDFENTPPSETENLRNKLLICGDQLWDHYEGSDRPSDLQDDGYVEFQEHSPVSDAEMWGRRLHRDGIRPYWTPGTLGYFFDTLTSWDTSHSGDYIQNASNVSSTFNEGWYHVFFDTHGSPNSWSLEEGSFNRDNASGLTGITAFVYTGACNTGWFDSSGDPCLSEAFVRNPDGGALAYFGCSRFGWGWSDEPPASNTSRGGPSVNYAYKFYEQLFNSDEDVLGRVFSQHKVEMAAGSNDNGANRWIQFGLNYQGDPAILVKIPLAILMDRVLPMAYLNTPYSVTIDVQGGKSPYTWSLADGEVLPLGLSLDSALGQIIGAPTQSGNFEFTLEVTDNESPANVTTKTFELNVMGPSAVLINPPADSYTPNDLKYIELEWIDLSGQGINFTSVDPNDISMDGIAFDAISYQGNNTWRYSYTPPLPIGEIDVEVNANEVQDNAGNWNIAQTLRFGYDPTAPNGTLHDPVNGDTIYQNRGYVDILWFDADSGIDTGSLDHNDITLTNVTIIEDSPENMGNGVYRYRFDGEPYVGVNTVTFNPGEVTDLVGNGIAGHVETFIYDPLKIVTESLPSANVGTDYRVSIEVEGGVEPYTWSLEDPNLLCYWTFDEGEGTTVFDYSSYDHTGTVIGATWAEEGRFGGALEFGGDGDYVVDEFADAYLNGMSELTISMWIKSEETNTDRGFINCEEPDGGDNVCTMRYDVSGTLSGGSNLFKMAVTSTPGGEQQLESSSNLQTTEWQHVALTWSDGGLIRFYVNGVEDTPAARRGANNVGTISGCTKLIIGKGAKDEGSDTGWHGLIDEVAIWADVLTADEIQHIMNNTSSNTLPPNLSIDSTTGLLSGPLTQPGSHEFTISVTDSHTPMNLARKTYTLDVAGPFAQLLDPPNGSYINYDPGYVYIQWNAFPDVGINKDTIDINDLSIDGVEITTAFVQDDESCVYSYSGSTLNEGQVNIQINANEVQDNAGIWNVEQSFSLIYDQQPPTGTLQNPSNGDTIFENPGFVDILWHDNGLAGIDTTSLDENDIVIPGVTIDGPPTPLGADIYRYNYSGDLPLGQMTVTFVAGEVADRAGNVNPGHDEFFIYIIPATIYLADFEDEFGAYNDEGFTYSGDFSAPGTNLWHATTHRANSSSYSQYYGQEELWHYDTGTRNAGNLLSPEISLVDTAGPIELSFMYHLITESYQGYDIASVWISNDNGENWTELANNQNDGLFDPTFGWISWQADVSSYAGDIILLRFNFDTMDDQYNNYEGWYIDDVNITGIFEGQIQGSKWNDQNGDGIWDEGEPGLPGWTIYLDLNNNGQHDSDDEPYYALTDADGNYSIPGLPAGTYTVAEKLQSGWKQTYPGVDFRLLAGTGSSGTNPESLVELQTDPPGVEILIGGPSSLNLGLDVDPTSGLLYGASDSLRIIDSSDGSYTTVGTIIDSATQTNLSIDCIAFSPEGTLYGLSLTTLPTFYTTLYTIDKDTALATEVGPASVPTWEIDFAPDGTLYSVGEDLFILDPATGETLATIGSLGTTVLDIDFAPDGYLYGIHPNSNLYRIDPSDASTTLVGTYESQTVSIASEVLTDNTHEVTLSLGESVSGINFGNQAIGEIHGSKWHDLNQNGFWDIDEPGLANWTIYLDIDNSGDLNDGDISTTTDANGNYSFTGLPAGTYTVTEVLQDGWRQTYPTGEAVSSPDEPTSSVDQGYFDFEHIDAGLLREQVMTGPATIFYDYVEDGVLKGGSLEVDPTDEFHTATLPIEPDPKWTSTTIIDNGPSANRIDLVFVGDGYTLTDLETYTSHVNNITSLFFAELPLDAYSSFFNVHRVDVISNESGVDNDPTLGIERDTALDMAFWGGGMERLLVVNVNKALTAASDAPDVDQVLAIANSTKYGGAGYSGSNLGTISGGNNSAVEIALHEFGHSFADLADEYDYGQGPIYNGPEPVAANVSIYDATTMAGLATKWHLWLDEPNVDTFEGAMYHEFGIYRPTDNSLMRSLNRPFEQVNVEQFVLSMYESVQPIDSSTPPGTYPKDTVFFVDPLDPGTHSLDVQWYVDGSPILGATETSLDASVLGLAGGTYTLSVKVVDNTDLVRDEALRNQWMTEERAWTLEFESASNNTHTVVLGPGEVETGIDFGNIALVKFNDPDLEATVEEALGIIDPTVFDIKALDVLFTGHRNIEDLTGLEHAENLEYLMLWGNHIEDISPLLGLSKLKQLVLSDNEIAGFDSPTGWGNLMGLYLSDNQIETLPSLEELTSMRTLDLSGNRIKSISTLTELISLTYLDLRDNPLNPEAYSSHLAQIQQNNPGIHLLYDPQPNGRIRGSVWNDIDGDGFRDQDEAGLEGWTIYADKVVNGEIDPSVASTTTNADGSYELANLYPATYIISEVIPQDWEQTYPGGDGTHTVIIVSDEIVTGIHFGNWYNEAPVIGSLSLSANPIVHGEELTLTAHDVTDDHSVVSVAFYRDDNTNGIGEPGELLGTDDNGADGWSWSGPATWAAGNHIYLAQATDDGIPVGVKTSDWTSITGTVRDVLTIITESPLPPAGFGRPYSTFIETSGGIEPHRWSFYIDPSDNYVETQADLGMPGSSSAGSPMDWSADDDSYELQLPWAFNFYGTEYSSVWVSTNGFLDFTSPAMMTYSNSLKGLQNAVRIAPLWDDLTTEEGDIYVDYTLPDVDVFIRWEGHTYQTDDPVNFSVTLSRDGKIRFDYYIEHNGLTPTIGLSAGNASQYVLSHRDGAVTIEADASSAFAIPGSDPLPEGLSLNKTTGEISGVPTEYGSFDFTIVVKDSDSSASQVSKEFHLDVTNIPDLVGTFFNVIPDMVSWGENFDVNYTVLNQGSADAGAFDIGFYLSEDTDYDMAVDSFLTFVSVSQLAVGASTSGTATVTLPSSSPFTTQTGTFYVVMFSDDLNEVVESDENNNHGTGYQVDYDGFTILPDLVGTYCNVIPDLVNWGESFDVDYTVRNQGSGDTGAFDIGFYLSEDTDYDTGLDSFLTFVSVSQLAAGASTSGTAILMLPSSPPFTTPTGSYYVVMFSDDLDEVVESDETNNHGTGYQVDYDDVTVLPDLVGTFCNVIPDMADWGESFDVDYTVLNQGSADAGAFDIGFYLSEDSDYDAGVDSFLTFVSVSQLAVGISTSGTATIILPSSSPFTAQTGTFYVVMFSDDLNEVAEFDETNNHSTGYQVDYDNFAVLPDLVGTYCNVIPDLINWGESFDVDYTVLNQGSTDAGAFDIGFYLSEDTNYDEEVDSFLTFVPVSQLAAGAGTSGTTIVTLSSSSPFTAQTGTFYVVMFSDDLNEVAEFDETNNHGTGYQIDYDEFDIFVITTPSSLPPATLGLPYSVVLNAEGGTEPYTWSFKAKGGYEETDPGSGFVGGGTAMGWQTDDGSYELTLPWTFEFYGADYNSVWVCTNGFIDFTSSTHDYSNSQIELINSVRIAPLWDDLDTRDGDIYVDTTNPDAVAIRWEGETLSGENPVDFMVTLNQDGTIRFDYGQSHSGLTPTIGLSAGDGTRYTLSVRDGVNDIPANVASLFSMAGNPLPPGLFLDEATGEISGVPTEFGAFEFTIVVTDSDTPVNELTKDFLLEVRGPDLVGTHCSVIPDMVDWGESFDVDYTVLNQGSADAGAFDIGFYLSEDTDYDIGVDSFLTFVPVSQLAAGASTNGTATITLPSSSPFAAQSGTFYVVMFTDDLNEVVESDETNNHGTGYQIDYDDFAIPPDLVGTYCNAIPNLVTWGESFDLDYTVLNQGSANAGAFDIGFYLSEDTDYDMGVDSFLTAVSVSQLTAGASTSGTATVTLPSSSPFTAQTGTFYVMMFSDDLDVVVELDETNNHSTGYQIDYDDITFPSLNLVAHNPTPANGAIHTDTWASLNWEAGDTAVSHDIYVGESFIDVQNGTGGTFRGNQTATFFVVGFPGFPYPDGLVPGTTYYWRVDEIDAGGATAIHTGFVWSFMIPPKTAYNPSPADGAMSIDPTAVTLSWAAGFGAKIHHVYLGDNLANVEAGTPNTDTYKGATGTPSFNPGLLELEKTYFWRVDEYDEVATYKGDVWNFTTGNYLVVDDIESYTNNDPAGEAIWQHWIDGWGISSNGSQVGYLIPPYAEQTIVHSGNQSMPFFYNNTDGVTNSIADLTLTWPRDWTTGEVAELSLWFRGNSANDPEPLYVAISNASGASAMVYHVNPAAAQTVIWTEWRISLQTFAAQGIDLTSVNKISVGLGGAGGSSNGDGLMYFDDFRLYRLT